MRLTAALFALFVLAGCIGESDYQAETGTFSIPWGQKEGKNIPPEDLEAALPPE